jgi:hypothetical protein
MRAVPDLDLRSLIMAPLFPKRRRGYFLHGA